MTTSGSQAHLNRQDRLRVASRTAHRRLPRTHGSAGAAKPTMMPVMTDVETSRRHANILADTPTFW